MFLDILITWIQLHGRRAAALLAIGLFAEWLCMWLGSAVERRLASTSTEPGGLTTLKWPALVSSAVRSIGHSLLMISGMVVVLDILGLRLDISALWNRLSTAGGQIGVVVILALSTVRVVDLAAGYAERAVRSHSSDKNLAQRAQTVGSIARSFGIVAVTVTAILMILATLGLDTTPLLASAGILGIAIGFGAQTLVKDVISGLFILLEDQFAVGDRIQVGNAVGTVERMTIRSTNIRDFAGALYIIPNGEIRTVANLTRGWSRAIIDAGISNAVPIEQGLSILQRAISELADDPAVAPLLQGEPQVLGIQEVAVDWTVLRAILTTKPGEQALLWHEANRRIREAFAREGLSVRLSSAAATP